jgi:hypothetical protein
MKKKNEKPELSAEVMHPDGRTERVYPTGNRWSLKELQELVGGYIELVSIAPAPGGPPHGHDRCAVVNEEGHRLELPLNYGASLLLGQVIVGPVVIIRSELLD